jgi:DNA-binding CsgD family transcriptional regulator
MWVTAARALVAGSEGGANDLFLRALARPAIHQWPFDVARLRLSYGEYLLREHAEVEARHQLDLARDTFDRLRAQPWVYRVDAQIRKLVEKPGGTVETAGLTAKEYAVAQLAARGLTNKQIGAELFLSPRTVGTYLYRAYPKLGVSTRAALRDALNGHQPTAHS